jgi:type IV secretory pathway TrbD component
MDGKLTGLLILCAMAWVVALAGACLGVWLVIEGLHAIFGQLNPTMTFRTACAM